MLLLTDLLFDFGEVGKLCFVSGLEKLILGLKIESDVITFFQKGFLIFVLIDLLEEVVEVLLDLLDSLNVLRERPLECAHLRVLVHELDQLDRTQLIQNFP